MSPRWPIACLLAVLLQLAGPVASRGDLVICVSADGRAALEFAVPGTGRCGDSACGGVLTEAADRSCRDIPVLSAGDSLATGTAASIQPAVAAAVVSVPLPAATRPSGRILLTPPRAATRQRRSVVLIL